MSRPSGLGQGLSALIPAAAPGQSGLVHLHLDQIVPNPRQPRSEFDQAALEELAASIRAVGLLQPIIVRPVQASSNGAPAVTDPPAAGRPSQRPQAGGDTYEIVAGERRYRAARLAGLDEIAAVVRHTGDDEMLTEALVENLHRANLNALEEALAYQHLLDDFGITHEALAARLGKSRSAISNALRLLGLPAPVQERVAGGTLSAGHARALLSLPNTEQQERTAQRVVADGLSVRATEDLVRRFLDSAARENALAGLARAAKAKKQTPYAHVERRLSDALGTKVEIRGSARRGRVMIDYAGKGDLERLLDILSRGTGEDLLSG
ncbi:MAG: ParB/RepB/Spo0J family partition protein [Egibacteraceae bacterium]